MLMGESNVGKQWKQLLVPDSVPRDRAHERRTFLHPALTSKVAPELSALIGEHTLALLNFPEPIA